MKRVIAYVNHVGCISGAERSLLSFLAALDRTQWEPVVICPQGGLLNDELRGLGVEVRDVEMVRLRRSTNPMTLLRYAWAWRARSGQMLRVLRSVSPDVVHCNSTIAQCYAARIKSRIGAPVIWHVRDLRGPSPVLRYIAARADSIVAISRAVEKALPGKIDRRKLVVIPNGIDVEAFTAAARPAPLREQLGLADGVPVLLMAGQVIPWKGHVNLIKALRIVRKKGQQFAALIAGEDLFQDHLPYLQEIKKMCSDFELDPMVHFLGFRSDMASLIALADLVVIPSRAEPFGRLALEAMALSKPVVGTDTGGLPEVVKQSRTGILVRPEQPAELAEAILALLRDPTRRTIMGSEGRTRLDKLFDIRQNVSSITQLYERLLEPGAIAEK